MLDSALPHQIVQEATEHLLAKPLLLGLGDKSEACRELAINMLIALLQVLAVHHSAYIADFMSLAKLDVTLADCWLL